MRKHEYSMVIHNRNTEDDPRQATIIYSIDDGWCWHPMAQCDVDYAEDIIRALYIAQNENIEKEQDNTQQFLIERVIEALRHGPVKMFKAFEGRLEDLPEEWFPVYAAFSDLERFETNLKNL